MGSVGATAPGHQPRARKLPLEYPGEPECPTATQCLAMRYRKLREQLSGFYMDLSVGRRTPLQAEQNRASGETLVTPSSSSAVAFFPTVAAQHSRSALRRVGPGAGALRQELRLATRAAHDATEEAFAGLDLNDRDGLACTLQAHLDALEALSPSVAGRQEFANAFEHLSELARNGLNALGRRVPASSATACERHLLGVAYVVLGSRLGARLIRQGLAADPAPAMAIGHQYFTDETTSPLWRVLMCELEHVPEPESSEILEAAFAAFALFEGAARRARATSQPEA